MQTNPFCESLESRRLLSVSLSDGILVVQGTSADDRLNIFRTVDDVTVDLNDAEQRFPQSQVSVILIDTGFGADRIVLSRTLQVRAQIKGGRGNDSISGGDGRDTIYGDGGNDYLFGGGGNDVLDPGGEEDTILGGTGNRDLVNYSDRTGDLHVDINVEDHDDGEAGEHDSVLLDVEIVLGGSGNDQLLDASGKNTTLVGGAGDDTLTGGAGRNTFDGGAGNDLADGFGNDDVFWFEDGQGDTIHGGSGTDAADLDNALDVATGIERNL
jgi:Ca2+-binding RTX toxin-like protein